MLNVNDRSWGAVCFCKDRAEEQFPSMSTAEYICESMNFEMVKEVRPVGKYLKLSGQVNSRRDNIHRLRCSNEIPKGCTFRFGRGCHQANNKQYYYTRIWCSGCKVGHYQSDQTCKPCPSPSWSSGSNSSHCSCPRGYFWSDEDCKECPRNFFSQPGSTVCTSCPANSTSTRGSHSCICPAGHYFNMSHSSGQCERCSEEDSSDFTSSNSPIEETHSLTQLNETMLRKETWAHVTGLTNAITKFTTNVQAVIGIFSAILIVTVLSLMKWRCFKKNQEGEQEPVEMGDMDEEAETKEGLKRKGNPGPSCSCPSDDGSNIYADPNQQ